MAPRKCLCGRPVNGQYLAEELFRRIYPSNVKTRRPINFRARPALARLLQRAPEYFPRRNRERRRAE